MPWLLTIGSQGKPSQTWLLNNRITMEAKFNNGSQVFATKLELKFDKKSVHLQSTDNE